jgi:hypothetical protein
MLQPRRARLEGGLAVAVFALFLAAGLQQAVSRAWAMLHFAARAAGNESFDAARARFSGPAYVAAIDAIRDALPPDQPYLLVEGGRPQDGDLYWVRFDLAPRRAIYLGQLDQLTDVRRLRQRFSANVRQVIVAYGPGEPPRLLERYRFVQEVQRRAEGAGTGDPPAPPGSDASAAPASAPPGGDVTGSPSGAPTGGDATGASPGGDATGAHSGAPPASPSDAASGAPPTP